MSSPYFWDIFEPLISLLENFLLIDFLTSLLDSKPKSKKELLGYIGALVLLFSFSFIENEKWIAYFEIIITIILLFLYAFFFTKGTIVQKIIAAITARTLTMISNSAVLFISSLIFDVSIDSFIEQQNTLRIIVVLLSKIIYFFLGRLVIILVSHKKLLSWQWITIGANLLCSTFAGTGVLYFAYKNSIEEGNDQLQLLLIISCIWIYCIITYFILQKLVKDNEVETEYKLLNQKQEYQEHSLEMVMHSNEEIKSIKHDLKNYILTIQSLVFARNYEKAISFCSELTHTIDNIQVLVKTGNELVDAILNEKLSESKQKGIDTKCTVFSDLEHIDALHFCTVLGNLFDNAIEAEEKLPVNNRKIIIEISNYFGFVSLIIKNIIENSVLNSNNKFISTKANKEIHGIGHRSIEQTLCKSNGSIRYLEENNFFIAEVLFPL